MVKAGNNIDLYLVFEFMDTDLHVVIKNKLLQPVHHQYIMYQVPGEGGREGGRELGRGRERETDMVQCRNTDRQKDRQTDRQTDGLTFRQTDRRILGLWLGPVCVVV